MLAAVGLSTRVAPWTDRHGAAPHLADHVVIQVSRRSVRGWSAPKVTEVHGWLDAWEVLDALAATGRRVYVVASRALDALTMLHFWERVERKEVVLWHTSANNSPDAGATPEGMKGKRHPLIFGQRADVIGYTCRRSSFRWVSVTNWCDVSLRTMAEQVGVPVPPMADDLDSWEYNRWPAVVQAEVIGKYMRWAIDWWLKNGCGMWRDTIGAAAWSTFLKKSEDIKIVTHEIPEVQLLEDRACHGGRVAAWYYGDVGDTDRWGDFADAPPPGRKGFGLSGPVYRYDVKAMYPTLMRDNPFPLAFIRRDVRPSLHSVRVGLRNLLAVAAVRVRTPVPETPVRHRAGSVYPVGRVDAVLTTPSLSRAMSEGRIERVWDVAWYSAGYPFRQWAEWGLALRKGSTATAHSGEGRLAKTLVNSLTGRLARKRIGWVDDPDTLSESEWGTFTEDDPTDGGIITFRAIAGHVQRMSRDDTREGTLAACYAHLTDYGRCTMDAVRSVCGERQVIWQDTDGVIVTALGSDRLERSPYYHPNEYGKLRRDRVISNLRIFTPKHYWADGQWVLAGIQDGFTVDADAVAHSVRTGNPVRSAIRPHAAAVYRSIQHVDIRRIEPGVTVGHDGWAVPPELWKGEPPAPRPTGQLPLWADPEDV